MPFHKALALLSLVPCATARVWSPVGADERIRAPEFLRRRKSDPCDDRISAAGGPQRLVDMVRPRSLADLPRKLWQECQSRRPAGVAGAVEVDDRFEAYEQTEPPVVTSPPPAEGEAEADESDSTLSRRQRRQRARAAPLIQQEASMEESAPFVDTKGRKKRVLMLISDTGGGHRASAQALESMFEQLAPGQTDVRIVDIWTEYCPFPFSHFVQAYQHMAKNPWIWRYTWYSSAWAPNENFLNFASRVRCGSAFRKCIDEVDPDLVVSVHPLTQHIPLRVLTQKVCAARARVLSVGGVHTAAASEK